MSSLIHSRELRKRELSSDLNSLLHKRSFGVSIVKTWYLAKKREVMIILMAMIIQTPQIVITIM